jgi:hypothetical protein
VTNKINSGVADAWSTLPWPTSHTIGGHHHSMTDIAEQAQSEQTPAGIAEAKPHTATTDEQNGGES